MHTTNSESFSLPINTYTKNSIHLFEALLLVHLGVALFYVVSVLKQSIITTLEHLCVLSGRLILAFNIHFY